MASGSDVPPPRGGRCVVAARGACIGLLSGAGLAYPGEGMNIYFTDFVMQ